MKIELLVEVEARKNPTLESGARKKSAVWDFDNPKPLGIVIGPQNRCGVDPPALHLDRGWWLYGVFRMACVAQMHRPVKVHPVERSRLSSKSYARIYLTLPSRIAVFFGQMNGLGMVLKSPTRSGISVSF